MINKSLIDDNRQIESVAEFVKNLRRYKKTDILNVGTKLIWDTFQNKKNYSPERIQVINASYGPKLILMGLATANDFRDNKLDQISFFNLCNDLLGIKDPISDQSFMNNESSLIVENLKSKNIIPHKYLTPELMSGICPTLFIARILRQQHEIFLVDLNDFYMTYDVLILLDKSTNGKSSKDFQSIFGITPLDFIRASFGLFAIGNGGDRSGRIVFEGLTCDDSVRTRLNIDIETCRLVATKISYNESSLRQKWYENEVLKHPQLYQKYHPTPLYKTPLIHMDVSNKKRDIDYLIPSPQIYIRAIRNSIFANLLQNDKNLSSKIGEAVEDHIFCALKNIFGDNNVSKIPNDPALRSADFFISLSACDLIIECKTAAGAYDTLSIMSPEDIADIWSKFYRACEQCSASITKYQNNHKPIIPIVLIADHITAETMPFQTFAIRSGMFDDMGTRYIEFISWNGLQHGLSGSSLEKFAEKLIERKNKDDGTVRDILTFNLDRDTPANNYDFLKESEYRIFGKNFERQKPDFIRPKN